MRTVMIIHGTADCAANWRPWAESLEKCGWRAVAVDLPGYGPQARPQADCSVAACAEHLIGAVERYQPTALLGHSLGANVAIELALRRIAPLVRLLLVCPAVDIPPLTRHFYDWFVEAPLEALYRQRDWLNPWLASYPRLATANRTAPASIRRTWQSLKTWPTPDWRQLTLPTAIVGGLWDPIAPPLALEALRRRLPAARLTLLPCRHLPMDDAPVAFGRWLVRSLQDE
ncbi:MAG: alpha/beta hydrolase [Aphanocapsa lilacina HA4352-LM1]|jgi:pimeloyl-ACP methyl ester carboxylesterase|nr:alpha/beta hydrolase [Aphanocapsa lilacina HA4352-LM1]